MPQLTYDEAVDVLLKATRFGTNPSLDGIRRLVSALDAPQYAFERVQVAGTNGKTSTARITAALLGAHGLKTGLYTSPELERYPERMEIAGTPVSDDDFACAIGTVLDAADSLDDYEATEFELLTAAALWLFRERGVQVAVLEAGLGGRWDATSVAPPSVAVITGIGLDHIGILGSTRLEIAAEKAAIIHRDSVPILGPGTEGVEEVFLEQAASVHVRPLAVREHGVPSPVNEGSTVRYRVVGRPHEPLGSTVVAVDSVRGSYACLGMRAPAYQAPNIATAVAASEAALGRALDDVASRDALSNLAIPGRFEVMRHTPPAIVDAAHNPQAAAALAEAVRETFGERKPTLLLGVLSDKDARGIASALAPVVAGIAVTRSRSARALEPGALAEIVEDVTGVRPTSYRSVAEAIAALSAHSAQGLLVTGSITIAGEARAALRHTS